MALTERPAAWRAVMADSRPAPGPLTRTSISLRPNLVARSAAISAARWAANGVLLRLPLNPTVPAEAKHNVSPLVSVMVTMVLLKVALIWATPRLTLRLCLRFLLLATAGNLPGFLTAQFLHALLAGHGLARALAGTRIGPGPLATHRQAAAMAKTAVAGDVFQAGDVLLHLPAQGTFDRVIPIENTCQTAEFIVGQFLGATLRIDFRLFAKAQCHRRADAVNVTQRNMRRLVIRKVNTQDTGHGSGPRFNLAVVCGADLCKLRTTCPACAPTCSSHKYASHWLELSLRTSLTCPAAQKLRKQLL